MLFNIAAALLATTASATPILASRDLWHSDAWLGCVSPAAGYTAEKFTSLSMTPQICQDTCASKNYMYAVVTAGNTCACTNDIADEDVTSELLCTATCVGDVLLSCGGLVGTGNWDVYLTPTVSIS